MKGRWNMKINEISGAIVDCALRVHKALGPGLLESVYESALVHELRKQGFSVERQVGIPVIYDGFPLGIGFRIDLLVENLIVVELKSIEEVSAVHKKQLLTYLKLSGKPLGLLINFGETLLKSGITRIVNGLTVETGKSH